MQGITLNEFSSLVFIENKVKTSNAKVLKERPYYISILMLCVSIIFILLDLPWAGGLIIISMTVYYASLFWQSGRKPSIGHHPVDLKLLPDALMLGKERIELKNKRDLRIRIVGYRGQLTGSKIAPFKTHSGNDNVMHLRYANKVTAFNFVLHSEHHKDQLLKFCEAHGFEWYS